MAEDDEKSNGTRSRADVEDNSLGRLLTLADGIFAIAMTLLALDLHVPDMDYSTDADLRHELAQHSASYLSFLLSFYVIASYWSRHRRLMRSVVAIHPIVIRDTLFVLVIVAAMPFFAALLGSYGSKPTALALYGAANVLAVLALLMLSFDAERLGLLDKDDRSDPADSYARRWQTWLNLAVFTLCIPGAYLLGGHGPYVLLLLAIPSRLLLFGALYRRIRASLPTRVKQ
jgi:uncharacterized membrane protein